MAKVTLPLGSFGARGQLGKAFVYFPWKGIHCVRSFVIPANPNTADQQTQRGHFSDAVDSYHAANYNAIDITALRLWASKAAKVMTYFNRIVKEFVDVLVSGNTWATLFQGVISGVGVGGFTFEIECATNESAVMHYGTSAGYMPETDVGSYTGTTWTYTITGLNSNTVYYWYISNDGIGDMGRTGIYKQKTT